MGIAAEVVPEDAFAPPPAGAVVLLGNANWYPRAVALLEATPPERRPFVVVWHSEPLPFPAGAGFPRPRLHAREIAKIALRDRRATDPYTNARRLRRMARHGLPDLVDPRR